MGEARWWLLPDTAALKVAPLSYMFSLPDNKTFYCVTFAEDTQPEVPPFSSTTPTHRHTYSNLLKRCSCDMSRRSLLNNLHSQPPVRHLDPLAILLTCKVHLKFLLL